MKAPNHGMKVKVTDPDVDVSIEGYLFVGHRHAPQLGLRALDKSFTLGHGLVIEVVG